MHYQTTQGSPERSVSRGGNGVRWVGVFAAVTALLIIVQIRITMPLFSIAFDRIRDNHQGGTVMYAQQRGIVQQRSKIIISTFANAPGDGSRLVNGDYSLRINQDGELVIEERVSDTESTVVWRAPSYSFYEQDDWDNMFLTVEPRGLLMVVQEVKASHRNLKRGCERLNSQDKTCRVVTWTSGLKGDTSSDYVVLLSDNGVLRVQDVDRHVILWNSQDTDLQDEELDNQDYSALVPHRIRRPHKLPGWRTKTRISHNDTLLNGADVKIAWLMSFPNSGTSYTLQLVRNAGLVTAATNYGKEKATWDVNGTSMPVYQGPGEGPFWIGRGPLKSKFKLPRKVVLTKTHCGGYCMNCTPHKSKETLASFIKNCRTGMRRFINEEGLEMEEEIVYSRSLVERAVHLIRNPFDNIVARFHLFSKSSPTPFPRTREGFLESCRIVDESFGTRDDILSFANSTVAADALENVPCRADFLRYAQWHNLAFLAAEKMGLPTHILHYERYNSNFHQTASTLLDFISTSWKGDAPDFLRGKEYSQMYTPEELSAVRVAMKALSSEETWSHIHHYFEAEGISN